MIAAGSVGSGTVGSDNVVDNSVYAPGATLSSTSTIVTAGASVSSNGVQAPGAVLTSTGSIVGGGASAGSNVSVDASSISSDWKVVFEGNTTVVSFDGCAKTVVF